MAASGGSTTVDEFFQELHTRIFDADEFPRGWRHGLAGLTATEHKVSERILESMLSRAPAPLLATEPVEPEICEATSVNLCEVAWSAPDARLLLVALARGGFHACLRTLLHAGATVTGSFPQWVGGDSEGDGGGGSQTRVAMECIGILSSFVPSSRARRPPLPPDGPDAGSSGSRDYSSDDDSDDINAVDAGSGSGGAGGTPMDDDFPPDLGLPFVTAAQEARLETDSELLSSGDLTLAQRRKLRRRCEGVRQRLLIRDIAKTIQLLLDSGANPDGEALDPMPPLHGFASICAQAASSVSIMRLLVRGGASATTSCTLRTTFGRSVAGSLLDAVAYGGSLEAYEIVRHMPGGAELPISGGSIGRRTPLHWATARRRKAMLSRLLSDGAEVNSADADGTTPLHNAVDSLFTFGCRALMEAGADPFAWHLCSPTGGESDDLADTGRKKKGKRATKCSGVSAGHRTMRDFGEALKETAAQLRQARSRLGTPLGPCVVEMLPFALTKRRSKREVLVRHRRARLSRFWESWFFAGPRWLTMISACSDDVCAQLTSSTGTGEASIADGPNRGEPTASAGSGSPLRVVRSLPAAVQAVVLDLVGPLPTADRLAQLSATTGSRVRSESDGNASPCESSE